MAQQDKKLNELAATLAPGETLTAQQIADYTGIGRSTVGVIEARAFKKLKRNALLYAWLYD